MRGQIPTFSHVITIGFGVILIVVIVYTFGVIESNYRNFVNENEMEQACYLIKSGIEKIYHPGEYNSESATETGRIVIKLPQKISKKNYRAEFSDYSVIIKNDEMNKTCPIGYPAVYIGSTTGGLTEITVLSYNDTNIIKMERSL